MQLNQSITIIQTQQGNKVNFYAQQSEHELISKLIE